MSNGTVTLLIEAKNKIGRGLVSATKELSAFAHNLQKTLSGPLSLFRNLSIAAAGFGAAVVGFFGKAIAAYSEEERTIRKVSEAFRAFGEEVNKNTEAVRAFAEAQQELTGVDKNVVMSSMAALRMYGVRTDALQDAAKAVIALRYAGIDEAAAAKMVAQAYAGEYGMLTRYIPQLKTANTEAEKAAIVNAFLTRNYAAQKGTVSTLSGAWDQFKFAVGDAMEEVGKRLSETGGLQAALKAIKDLVKSVTESFSEWAAGGGLANVLADTLQALSDIRNALWDITHLGTNLGAAITEVFGTAIGGKDVASQSEKLRKLKEDFAKGNYYQQTTGYLTLHGMETKLPADKAAMQKHIDEQEKALRKMEAVRDEYGKRRMRDEAISKLRQKMTASSMGLAKEEEKKTDAAAAVAVAGASPDIAAAAAKREALKREYAQSITTIENAARTRLSIEDQMHQKSADMFRDNEIEREAAEQAHKKRQQAILEQANDELEAAEKSHAKAMKEAGAEGEERADTNKQKKALKNIADEMDAREDRIQKLREEEKRANDEIHRERINNELKLLGLARQRMQEQLAAAEKAAGMTVKEALAEDKQKAARKKEFTDEDKRAERLRAFLARANQGGFRGALSREDAEWLKKHDELAKARKAVPKLQAQLQLNEAQREQLEISQAGDINKMVALLDSVSKQLTANLKAR